MYIITLNGPLEMSGAADPVEAVVTRQVPDGSRGMKEERVGVICGPADGSGLLGTLEENHDFEDGTKLSDILKEPVLLRLAGWNGVS